MCLILIDAIIENLLGDYRSLFNTDSITIKVFRWIAQRKSKENWSENVYPTQSSMESIQTRR